MGKMSRMWETESLPKVRKRDRTHLKTTDLVIRSYDLAMVKEKFDPSWNTPSRDQICELLLFIGGPEALTTGWGMLESKRYADRHWILQLLLMGFANRKLNLPLSWLSCFRVAHFALEFYYFKSSKELLECLKWKLLAIPCENDW